MRTQKLAWGLVLGLVAAFGCSSDGGGTTTTAEPITIALMTPKTGALGEVGKSFERVARAAVNEINVQGGINGRDLKLFVVDDESDPTLAKVLFNALADIGVTAVVGPARSGSVANVMTAAALKKLPLISPSSTAQGLENNMDDHYMFRNVSNDKFQGVAMAKYLAEISVPPVLSVVVVAEDSGYGTGLAESFKTSFAKKNGTVTSTILFPANLDTAGADAVVAKIVAANPTMVVMVALEQDALKICTQWDASGSATGVKWFFTDGARSAGFLATLPEKVVGSFGTAPSTPDTGAAYGVLKDRYEAANNDAIGDQVYASNVWDAVFLIAAALAQQDHDYPGEAFGGEHLRDEITGVSRDGQIYNAGQWADMLGAINSGGDVDYDGASGPCNFDVDGEAIGPYEVWRIDEDPNTHVKSFSRAQFLEAGQLME